jgi:hypothetical protein
LTNFAYARRDRRGAAVGGRRPVKEDVGGLEVEVEDVLRVEL